MAIDLANKLEKFGLTDKEAKVYLALLETGTAIVSDVAKKAEVNRSTAYVLLESLVKQDLASASHRENKIWYTPAPVEKLIDIAEINARKYAEKVAIAKEISQDLRLVPLTKHKFKKATFLEGLDGLKFAYEDTLTAKETIRAYASIENMHAALPGYFPDYYNRRAKKGISIRAIFPDTPESRERFKYNKQEKRLAFLVPAKTHSFSPELNIYDNKIVFMSLVEKFALIIESAELANAMKKVFELSWSEAERSHKTLNK